MVVVYTAIFFFQIIRRYFSTLIINRKNEIYQLRMFIFLE